MLDRELDPAKLDRLAAALERLCELERILSGRPLPGSLKPVAPGSRQGRRAAAPAFEPMIIHEAAAHEAPAAPQQAAPAQPLITPAPQEATPAQPSAEKKEIP
jgi:hypothetical protein